MINNNYILPFEFDKNQIKSVLLLLPLHREGLTSYLSPLLGQYGIRNIDFVNTFITTFNKQTNSIFEGDISADDLEAGLSDEVLTVPVYLSVYRGGKYTIKTGYSLIGSLYQTTFKKRRRYYRRSTFYRNYKKLLLLTIFSCYIEKTSTIDINSSLFRSRYKQIRNSLHRKN